MKKNTLFLKAGLALTAITSYAVAEESSKAKEMKALVEHSKKTMHESSIVTLDNAKIGFVPTSALMGTKMAMQAQGEMMRLQKELTQKYGLSSLDENIRAASAELEAQKNMLSTEKLAEKENAMKEMQMQYRQIGQEVTAVMQDKVQQMQAEIMQVFTASVAIDAKEKGFAIVFSDQGIVYVDPNIMQKPMDGLVAQMDTEHARMQVAKSEAREAAMQNLASAQAPVVTTADSSKKDKTPAPAA